MSTPRTDAQGYGDGRHPYVPTEFARQLERELEQERQDRKQADLDTIRALGERNDARAEAEEWKRRITPFLGVHAANYGRDHFGEGCMHYKHFDMLKEAGARMDDFKRCGQPDNLEGPGPTEQERRENARAIKALTVPERIALLMGKNQTETDDDQARDPA